MSFAPYNKAEIETGIVYDTGPRQYPYIETPISPIENWKLAMNHQKPCWLPMRGDGVNFTPRCIPDNISRVFINDGGPAMPPVGGKDMFGIEWVYVPVARGSMVRPGAPAMEEVADWKTAIQMPDVDSWDWEGNAALAKDYLADNRFKVGWHFTGYFERLISFMDFENAALAMIDEDQEEDLHELFQAITDVYKKIIKKQKEYFNIDMLFFHDDWGGQQNPFFSLETCRKMLVPYFKQIVECCHENDIIFNFHNCGKNEKLLPAIVEFGADCWSGQPINNKDLMNELYGDKVMIGIECPVPEDATDEEVERIAREFVEKYWPTYPERPVYLEETRTNARLRTRIYEISRQMP